jgi:Flp pilus assembly pilin Flp
MEGERADRFDGLPVRITEMSMTNHVCRFVREEEGLGIIEYVLLAALVSVAYVLVLVMIGQDPIDHRDGIVYPRTAATTSAAGSGGILA